jgi:hypothetical protein
MQICDAFDKMAQLAIALGVTNLKDREGAWVHQVDDQWTIAINGKDHDVEVRPDGSMGATLQPFHAVVFYNGWLASLLNPYGGEFVAGSAANENTFIEAIDRAIAKTKAA